MNTLKRSQMPDTQLVTEANHLVRAAMSNKLYNHSMRTHYLAVEYAKTKARDYDAEQLALACLFHDLGIAQGFYHCEHAFVFSSSSALKTFLLDRQYPKEKILPMMEAIDFHFSITPKWELGAVAGLLQIGAWMDVVGLRARQLPGKRNDAKRRFNDKGFFLHFNGCLVHQLMSLDRTLGIIAPRSRVPQGHYDIC